jgi:hypothetical protein
MSQARYPHAFNHSVRPDSEAPPADVRRAEHRVCLTERRPAGMWLMPVASAAIGVAALMEADAWLGAPDIEAGTGLAAVASVIGLVLIIIAVLEVVFAFGVWELRAWATRVGTATTLTALALTLLSAGRNSSGLHTMLLLLEIWTVWYLLSPRVQETFREHADPTSERRV